MTTARYNTNSKRMSKRSARTAIDADIPHLLDPSYTGLSTSSGSSSSGASTSNSPLSLTRTTTSSNIYVDREGRVHDPAYRMFATPDADRRRRNGQKRRRVRQSRSGELSETDSEDDDDEEEIYRPRSSFESSRRRSSFEAYPQRQPSYSTISAYPFPYTTTPITSSSLPSYYPRDPSSPFTIDMDEDVAEEDEEPVAPVKKSKRTYTKVEAIEGDDTALASFPVDSDSTTPSCMYALRLQWHSLNMRVRFGLFRTKKSIQRRVAGPRLPTAVTAF